MLGALAFDASSQQNPPCFAWLLSDLGSSRTHEAYWHQWDDVEWAAYEAAQRERRRRVRALLLQQRDEEEARQAAIAAAAAEVAREEPAAAGGTEAQPGAGDEVEAAADGISTMQVEAQEDSQTGTQAFPVLPAGNQNVIDLSDASQPQHEEVDQAMAEGPEDEPHSAGSMSADTLR